MVKEGNSFRFTFAVCDAKSQPGRGFNFMEWTPGINYGKNPFDFATLVLGGEMICLNLDFED